MGNPMDFNLAPDDGELAVPVAPSVPAKPEHPSAIAPAPVAAASITAAQPGLTASAILPRITDRP
ncbi:MAG TPA: hypothetical protein DIT28_02335 [Oxalobacteraceae bacterium]|jgi:hypothetical protein|nr:hypothetical protein [Oxalobacteraceae bacterium]HCN88002.1 hypothetical protein [Oxalobacteraceae bacterium]